MKIMTPKNCLPDGDYAEDVSRIVGICAARGYKITPLAAINVWRYFSHDEYACGWMWSDIWEDEEVFQIMLRNTTQEEK